MGNCKCQCESGDTDSHELAAAPAEVHEPIKTTPFIVQQAVRGVVPEESESGDGIDSTTSTAMSVAPLPRQTSNEDLEEAVTQLPRQSESTRRAGRLKGAVHTVLLSRKSTLDNRDLGIPENLKPCKPSGNGNRPKDYLWLKEVITKISLNKAADLGCTDTATRTPFSPLFVMFGACPNAMCSMQAVLFLSTIDREVDFWWVKPSKSDGTQLERKTLSRNSSGPHKNDPGRSKPAMQPLANALEKGEVNNGWRFGIEIVTNLEGRSVPRAFIKRDDGKSGGALYVMSLWQEDWTANPLARSKYIKGKILYQRNIRALRHFSRQYDIKDGVIEISDFEELQSDEMLPGDGIKQLYQPI